MALYRRGNIWWISCWRDGKHIQISTKLSDKRKARAVEQTILSAKDNHRDGGVGRETINAILCAIYGVDENKTKLDALWDEYLDIIKIKGSTCVPKSINDRHNTLDRFIAWGSGKKPPRDGRYQNIGQGGKSPKPIIYLEDVDGIVAQNFAIALMKECQDKRRKNILSDLAIIWDSVGPNHRWTLNPWRAVIPKVGQQSIRCSFTKEEEVRVLDEAKKIHIQWYVASVIAANTGYRYGDICRLKWSDIDLTNKVIRITPIKTIKSSGVKIVTPCSDSLYHCLISWYQQSNHGRHTPEDRVLPWIKGYGMKGAFAFSTALKNAGLDTTKYTFHSWRHTFRTRLAQAGVKQEIAMKLCGHTTEEMSRHYDHYDYISEMKEAISSAMKN